MPERVTVTPGTDGQKLDADALLTQVEEALAQGERELRVEPETLPGAELSGQVLHELIHVEPKAPGVDEEGKLTPAVIGLSVNAEEAQAILDQTAPGESCTIPLEYTPPGTNPDESMFYKDLLASVTTGGTVRKGIECIEYYRGSVVGIAAIYSHLKEIDGISITSL